MEYLNRVLGIRTVYQNNEMISLPNYIHARYRVQEITIDGKKAVFVYPKTELDPVNSVKKHLERIKRAVSVPVILVPEHLTYRQKDYLLRDRIPFIVEGRQIYLPFMALYLQERCDGGKPATAKMLPSAQILLLHYIYQGCRKLTTANVSQVLSFTPTSISRASRQLEEMGLLQTEKRGVQKVIFSDKTPKELFFAAQNYLLNPVKRTVYVSKAEIKEDLLISGYSALSEYSMLNHPVVACRATVSISLWDKTSSGRLQHSDDQCAVELWRYDPKKLSCGECVDRLSLALALREDRDERVEEAVEEMLKQVWSDIDGKGN